MDLFWTLCVSITTLFIFILWKFASSDADLTLLFTAKFGRSAGRRSALHYIINLQLNALKDTL